MSSNKLSIRKTSICYDAAASYKATAHELATAEVDSSLSAQNASGEGLRLSNAIHYLKNVLPEELENLAMTSVDIERARLGGEISTLQREIELMEYRIAASRFILAEKIKNEGAEMEHFKAVLEQRTAKKRAAANNKLVALERKLSKVGAGMTDRKRNKLIEAREKELIQAHMDKAWADYCLAHPEYQDA